MITPRVGAGTLAYEQGTGRPERYEKQINRRYNRRGRKKDLPVLLK